MQLIEINQQTWVIQGGTNIGLMTLATLKQRISAFKHIVAGHDKIYIITCCGA